MNMDITPENDRIITFYKGKFILDDDSVLWQRIVSRKQSNAVWIIYMEGKNKKVIVVYDDYSSSSGLLA